MDWERRFIIDGFIGLEEMDDIIPSLKNQSPL